MPKTIWLFLVRTVSLAYVLTRFYWLKSTVYRLLTQFKYRNTPVSRYLTIEHLASTVRPNLYAHDDWHEGWDAAAYPGWIEAVWTKRLPPPTHGFDCDKFALYEATVASQLPDVEEAHLLSVIWTDGWMPNGHAVCLLKMPGGGWTYMDYGRPSKERWFCLQTLAANVVKEYTGGKGVMACWLKLQPDLKPVAWG